MDNAEKLRMYLVDKNIPHETLNDDEGNPMIRFMQTLENGPQISIYMWFTADTELLKIIILNMATIDNPLKRDSVLDLLNELNCKYRYFKFAMDDKGHIHASYDMKLKEDYDPEDVLFYVFLILPVLQDEYKNFMKLCWM